ncbi:Vmc-like lipoprotein signal peptide domain-containing protein [Mycoplasma anserisalpingitidis]|uniref:Vmc-like lipoprotein signal peptide domain-containing protein n=1 Tax=Mycoplasma anserisalpingitidis TaxID=519450 RepID=UPI0011B112E8|nr:hypothetical protein [Mycoplasma anserisalpingitidis]QDY87358.1 hypothetical protein FOY45_00205 [Mycoplasma anserisalpingitidis]
MKIKSKIKLISIFSIPVATLSLTSIAASCTNNNVQNKPEQPSDSETNTPLNPEENNGENSETNTENPTTPEETPSNPDEKTNSDSNVEKPETPSNPEENNGENSENNPEKPVTPYV